MKRYGALPGVRECDREALNPNDRYAIAVMKDDVVIGHRPSSKGIITNMFFVYSKR